MTREYILKQDAIDAVCYDCTGKDQCMKVCADVERINAIPPAHVMEGVRCNDCYAYKKDSELARAAYLDPDKYCPILRVEMPPEGFCFYGAIAPANHSTESL